VPLLCTCIPDVWLHRRQSDALPAQTDASGSYGIENVPDGKYVVVAWHEGMKQTKPVTLAGTGKAGFALSK
jgi:hypothetical protein